MKKLKVVSAVFGSTMKRAAARKGGSDAQMSLVGHIMELRGHVVRGMMWFFGLGILSLIFMDNIITFLRLPFDRYQEAHGRPVEQLMTIGVFEVVYVNFKICLAVSLIAAVPFFIRELWLFISPALYPREKRIALPITVASVLMFYLGISFGFFVIVPAFLNNTLEWASHYAKVVLTFENYYNSMSMMAMMFGIIFEVPVVISLLGLAGIVKSTHLSKNRRIIFLGSFIVGAILAPPDVFSQVIVSIPLYLMCELSIISLKMIEKNRMNIEVQESDKTNSPE